MSDIQHIMAPGAPEPVAPFSHAVRANGLVFVTGQMPTLPGGGKRLVEGGIEAQTRQVLDNLGAVLAAAGTGWEKALNVRVYLTDFQGHYAAMNEVYSAYLKPFGALPTRTCVGVTGLAVGALVEIDLVALA
ncbi:reactive intermediate/imine deaminase [Tistlia consotensis]|uniref:Reactive intermediate/imine deaminase n=1 Tax=Tistlia consotensis USBA 355 TaxID=560819 RepID=A0A1Y6C4Q1_9PROT|nr:RidA family protein [Tistlia consotensis]SMF36220.1 reactive intermediate/imine deaminase [Tistlia consotensis USBA 355]SNR71624.1 reactive intermediate/imine deaminase [Tistlia consotensis]